VGVDPRPFTLRQLVWMSGERRRFEGLLAAWHGSLIITRMPFTAELLDPNELNPFKDRQPESAEMRRLKEWQARTRWRLNCTPPSKRGR